MHTILGANGIIGDELAKELRAKYTQQIKLVGRTPQAVHADDVLHQADLLQLEEVQQAVADTDIAYLTGAIFNSNARETQELLPRYKIDNIFDSAKFKERFPDFSVTTYREGIRRILAEM